MIKSLTILLMMIECSCEITAKHAQLSNQNMVKDLSIREDGKACSEPHKILGRLFVEESIMRKLDLTQQRFGRLIAIEETEQRRSKSVCWLCKCDCGKHSLVSCTDLRSGHTQSCGCFRSERLKETHQGKSVSRETKAKMRVAHLAISDETRAKMSSAQRLLLGSKSGGWKGGITKQHERVRGRTNYRQWRNKILEKRGHRCENCGKYESKIHLHHIKNIKDYPKLLMDEQNVKLLCSSCHTKLHHKLNFKPAGPIYG